MYLSILCGSCSVIINVLLQDPDDCLMSIMYLAFTNPHKKMSGTLRSREGSGHFMTSYREIKSYGNVQMRIALCE